MSAKEAAAPAAPEGKSKKKLILLIAVGVGVAGIGGGALAFMLGGKKDKDAAHTEVRKMPVFVDIESFTVNLHNSGKEDDPDRFMQIKLVAEIKDAANSEMVKTMMPSIRNEILLVLGSKTAQDLSTREGKEKLASDIVAAANKSLHGTPAAGAVEGVNFTHLIIQ